MFNYFFFLLTCSFSYQTDFIFLSFPGEEMNFIELLKSFGLDMASVANALGIDIHTLNSMANDELLHILTQWFFLKEERRTHTT